MPVVRLASTPRSNPTKPGLKRPVLTLTSDFGLEDSYVAEMKAVLLRLLGEAHLIDVTHAIARHDILGGSLMLQRVLAVFEPGTVHVAVVDPGVGSARRALAVELAEQWVVCPDNGLITWAWRRMGPGKARRITWFSESASAVFQGRDLFAPIAARLAPGEDANLFSKPIDDPVLLNVSPAKAPLTGGTVIHIDHFGNAITNIGGELLGPKPPRRIRIKGFDLGPVRRTYSDVPQGRALALIGSSGLLEIAVREGSASQELKIAVGDPVKII